MSLDLDSILNLYQRTLSIAGDEVCIGHPCDRLERALRVEALSCPYFYALEIPARINW
jgi:hypothetical protein